MQGGLRTEGGAMAPGLGGGGFTGEARRVLGAGGVGVPLVDLTVRM